MGATARNGQRQSDGLKQHLCHSSGSAAIRDQRQTISPVEPGLLTTSQRDTADYGLAGDQKAMRRNGSCARAALAVSDQTATRESALAQNDVADPAFGDAGSPDSSRSSGIHITGERETAAVCRVAGRRCARTESFPREGTPLTPKPASTSLTDLDLRALHVLRSLTGVTIARRSS